MTNSNDEMGVQLVQPEQDLTAIAKVMHELRPHLSIAELVEQMQLQQTQGYQIAYVDNGQEVIAVAGFVISYKLAWGKHIYVDDLVTRKQDRSTGAGGLLIKYLKNLGKFHDCQELHLDSGVQRFAAHRFYLRHGFDITSHHFQQGLT